MDEKISVIIPIYNVEKYLNRCIESVVNQTYRNLEIILVEDGSPDNCSQMCDEWAEKDERIKVIHKENGGLSDARNAGMEIMTGEYVFFVDSDDWIHIDTISLLRILQIKYNADIVECKAMLVNEKMSDATILMNDIGIHTYDMKESMVALLREKPLRQTVWNKLYKRDVVEGIPFEVGKYHEDEFWTYQVFDRVHKIVYADIELYYYYQRSDSIMGQAFSLKRLDAIEGRYRRLEMFKGKYPELVSEAKENLAFLIMYYGQKALLAEKEEAKRYFEVVEQLIKQLKITVQEKRRMSITHKLWMCGAKWNLRAVCKLRNMIKIGTS